MLFEAHRGVSTAFPENTLAAFRAAAAMGYDMVELDPAYTADGELCVLHDRVLNRTCRLSDGSLIPTDNMTIADATLDEVRALDAGLWKGEAFRGEKVPLLQEVLDFSRETGMPLKLDNKIFSFPVPVREKLYALVKASGLPHDAVGFTVPSVEAVHEVAAHLPHAPLHYDGPVTQAALAALCAVVPADSVTVWLPLQTPLTTWVKVAFASPELSALVHAAGARLGIWILHDDEELSMAEELGADIIETTGGVKPRH